MLVGRKKNLISLEVEPKEAIEKGTRKSPEGNNNKNRRRRFPPSGQSLFN